MEVNLRKKEILFLASVNISKILRKDLVEQETSQCGLHSSADFFTGCILLGHSYLNSGVKSTYTILISQNGFVYALEELALTDRAGSLLCQVINTQYHILGRNGNRTTVRGL